MRYVGFLRGMNLGRRRISNDELVAHFDSLGFDNPRAFLASGNVVFDTLETDERTVRRRLERGLAETLNYDVPTFVRSAERVRAIAAHQPFAIETLERSGGKLQVALLAEEPGASTRDTVLGYATEADHFAFEGRELYWLPSGGISESELDLAAIEDAVGPWTMRTRRTVERLAAKFLSD